MSMDPRERRREGSRRAQAALTKRSSARKRRRNKNLLLGGGGLLALIAAIIASLALLTGGHNNGYNSGPGTVAPTQSPTHMSQPKLNDWTYNTSLPSSGPHLDYWAPWNFLGVSLVTGEVIHSMEHGGVVVSYQPNDPALAAQVNEIVTSMGSACLVAGSYADMDAKVAATTWERILKLDLFDQQQLTDFINAYRGKLGPEASAWVNDTNSTQGATMNS